MLPGCQYVPETMPGTVCQDGHTSRAETAVQSTMLFCIGPKLKHAIETQHKSINELLARDGGVVACTHCVALAKNVLLLEGDMGRLTEGYTEQAIVHLAHLPGLLC